MEITFVAQATGYDVLIEGTVSHPISFDALNMTEERWLRTRTDTENLGQEFYDALFPAASAARQALDRVTTPENTERILLVLSDKRLENVPWEYTHTGREFLATRHHLLRALPADKRRSWTPRSAQPKLYALFADPARTRQRRIAVRQAWGELIGVAFSPDGTQQCVFANLKTDAFTTSVGQNLCVGTWRV